MEEIKKFWDTCSKKFAHIDINNYIEIFNKWDSRFLTKLNLYTELKEKTIIDYGTGNGILGIHLKNKYLIKKYVGIDISERQLKEAKKNLNENSVKNLLLKTPQKFSEIPADVFICQAVIQHFPSLDYLNEFLENINTSGIETIVLQIRHNEKTFIKTHGYVSEKDVRQKCWTNKEYINEKLKNYKILSDGEIFPNFYQFLIYKSTKV